MSKSHVVQVGFIMPVFAELIEAGINVEHLLKLSGLNKFNLSDPNLYVPVDFMYEFFTKVKHQQGIDDLAVQCLKKIDLTSLSQWGELIAYTPDLLSAFQFGIKNNGVMISNQLLELDINGATTTFRNGLIATSSIGRDQTETIAFSLLIASVRLATGANWAPLEIHFQSTTMPNLDLLFPSGCNAKIILGQSATAIKFPTSLLTLPMLLGNSSSHLEMDFPETGALSYRIERLLDSKRDDLHMNTDLIADMASLSTRTLQRHLAEEGTSISGIIGQWRFKKALEMLGNQNLHIKEISEFLGYNEVSNFNRAFRRWTNTTPSRYREAFSSITT